MIHDVKKLDSEPCEATGKTPTNFSRFRIRTLIWNKWGTQLNKPHLKSNRAARIYSQTNQFYMEK